MLSSTIIVNALMIQSIFSGVPCYTQTFTESLNEQVGQTITVLAETPQIATRDDITVSTVPVPIRTVFTSQIPTGAANGALIGSALKYVGVAWDCTRLVEQSLRDIGHDIGDVGPMGFGGMGTVFIDRNSVQPGDIMMRGGHVAIYMGNGQAIQGGYDGRVVVASDSPSFYSSFVRVN